VLFVPVLLLSVRWHLNAAVPAAMAFVPSVAMQLMVAMRDLGVDAALAKDPALAAGLNIAGGKVMHRSVAEVLGLEYTGRQNLVMA
jgi:alanine dehydrogenase